jgi:high-affinity iron transporter
VWDEAFPSLLIGLREGLEAGLIVSILIATLVRSDQKQRLPQVWTGVLAAAALAMSFGAVLTFTAANLPGSAQEAFGGSLSVVAVAFVTAMVFWMRRSARMLSKEIKEKTTAALAMGGGVLILTSFLAVGREGLETALFLWTTARAAGESTWPLAGAAVGLAIAAGLCWGLYRRVLHINLTRFFTATGIVLIVIAAGVLGYGLRDLQEGGVLPGHTAYAFDLSTHVDSGSWYATLLQGVLNITPQMTWLQVAAYLLYLAVVMALFVRGVRAAAPKPAQPEPRPEAAETAGRRPVPRWAMPVGVVAVPAVIAGLVIAVGGGGKATAQTVSVSATDCGKGFTAPKPGRRTFQMHNTGKKTAEVYLINPDTAAVYGEVEGLAPGVTSDLVATIGSGSYAWRCIPSGEKAVTSATVRVSGGGTVNAIVPVTERDLAGPLGAYKAYVTSGLATLLAKVQALDADIAAGDLAKAKADWLPAHLQYASLGAAYGTFADFDKKINGRPDGLPGGVHDKGFTGFHRIEYGLWHGEPASSLRPVADQLVSDVQGLIKAFPTQDFNAGDLALRTHEILENTLQFQLTGDEDMGSGTTLATASANISGTKELLSVLTPLIQSRSPRLLGQIQPALDRTTRLVQAAQKPDGSWTPLDQLSLTQREQLNGTMGHLLELLSPIPDLLEVRKSG